jgi:hypothetical protein
MKKLIVSVVLLSVMSIGVPKMAIAAPNCKTVLICGHYCVVCDFFDYVTWQEIYCGGSVLE